MSNKIPPGSEAADSSEINIQAPEADAVFPLVRDLGQLLLNWSWEGTLGLEDKIERVAGAYGQKVVSLITAESAIIHMGSR